MRHLRLPAQDQAGGEVDDRDLRRRLSAVPAGREGADPVRAVIGERHPKGTVISTRRCGLY